MMSSEDSIAFAEKYLGVKLYRYQKEILKKLNEGCCDTGCYYRTRGNDKY